jgi:hypothetical protein
MKTEAAQMTVTLHGQHADRIPVAHIQRVGIRWGAPWIWVLHPGARVARRLRITDRAYQELTGEAVPPRAKNPNLLTD